MYVQTTQFFIAVDAKDQIQQENDQTKYLTDTHTHNERDANSGGDSCDYAWTL